MLIGVARVAQHLMATIRLCISPCSSRPTGFFFFFLIRSREKLPLRPFGQQWPEPASVVVPCPVVHLNFTIQHVLTNFCWNCRYFFSSVRHSESLICTPKRTISLKPRFFNRNNEYYARKFKIMRLTYTFSRLLRYCNLLYFCCKFELLKYLF